MDAIKFKRTQIHFLSDVFTAVVVVVARRLDFRRLPGPVFDPPRGMNVGSFSRTAAGNRAYVARVPSESTTIARTAGV